VLNEGVGPSALSVEKMVKVATWPIQRRSGQREWDIIDEGILAHPHTQKVENPAEADFIIFVTVQDVDFEKKLILGEGSFANEGWNSKDWGPHIAKKMIVVDYADAPDDHGGLRELLDTRFGPPKVPFPVAQFKRSWLHKHNGTIWLTQKFGANEDAKGHEYTRGTIRYYHHRWNHFFPIAYALLDRSIQPYQVRIITFRGVVVSFVTSSCDRQQNAPHMFCAQYVKLAMGKLMWSMRFGDA
jgi:hypothetical protein